MKLVAVFLALTMLFGCVSETPVSGTEISEPAFETSEPEVFEIPEELSEPEPAEIKYIPLESKTPEIAVLNYFTALYNSYIAMLPVDLSGIIDTDHEMMVNVQNWNTLLAMRRNIISENDYCYVETESFPFTIDYISKKDLDDPRMDYVKLSDYGEGAAVLHFVIKGKENTAYPPIFALNSQHSMVFTFEDDVYKIAYHYFPGSEGKFQNDLPVTLMEKEVMEELLADEFAKKEEIVVPENKFERNYDPESAVEYAFEFCEEPNPAFHFVGDWFGNCMNFASQCIWSGFRTEKDTPKNYGSMTKNWYCGKPGGTLIWASVSRFWEWREQEYCGMQTVDFYDIHQAKNGDLVHIGSYVCETEDKYTHALMLVDSEKMMLAQNSPGCFVYFSDLVNNYARFLRPVSLMA